MKKNIIIHIMGLSGVGKSTVANLLNDLFIKNNYSSTVMIPYTTRPPRDKEKNGVDYHFVSESTMMDLIPTLLEHRKYNVKLQDGTPSTWYYGTGYPTNNISIIVGTVDSYQSIMTSLNRDEFTLFNFNLIIDEAERLYRVIKRELKEKNPNFRELSRRFIQETGTVYYSFNNIENVDSDKTAEEIYKIVTKGM